MKENFKKVFLDTTPLVYYLDKDLNFGEKSKKIIDFMLEKEIPFISLVITCEEYLVMPYINNNQKLIDNFWRFVTDTNMVLCPISHFDAMKAAQIRAKYKYFKPMDSLQLAVASLQGCDLFLTNDKQLKQYDEVKCMTIEEWEL